MLAHYERDTGKSQLLEEHLFNVAKEAAMFAKEIGQEYMLNLIGLYHDLGKADALFQRKLLEQPTLKVNHSSAGAVYLYQKIPKILKSQLQGENKEYYRTFCETIAYVISAHHGVYDISSESEDNLGENKLFERMEYFIDNRYHYEEDIILFAKKMERTVERTRHQTIDEVILKAFNEYVELWNKLDCEDPSEKAYYQTLIVRLYLSILKNADILDTINAYEEIIVPISSEKYTELSKNYLDSIENLYQKFRNPTTPINKIRTKIATLAKERGMQDGPGIYRLNLPTGAGKTNLSMRYGFHQMDSQKKKHFIYITAYLSVLEQNAAEIKGIVGHKVGNQIITEGVLEHHSNVVDANEDVENDAEIVDERKKH